MAQSQLGDLLAERQRFWDRHKFKVKMKGGSREPASTMARKAIYPKSIGLKEAKPIIKGKVVFLRFKLIFKP